jgi:hypothetical protein
MLTLPTRPVVPVFAATLKPSDPLPLPLAAVVSVIHATVLLAVHGHPGLVVMPTLPGPPAAGIDADGGCSEIVQETGGGAAPVADCEIVIAIPAAVIVPVRPAPLFTATVKLTLPLPDPDGGDTAIQPTLADAVHPHPDGAAIAMAPVPPDEGNCVSVAVTVSSQAEAS